MERERQARWDKLHIASAGTKLSRWDYIQLRAACAAEGTTVYALIRDLLLDWLQDWQIAQETGATEVPSYHFFGSRAAHA